MSVSARTFQLLYIIRQRALQDQSTRLTDFSEFIADRRKTAPALYGNAYISPSALTDLLGRMAIENLVTATDGEYQLEHMGSQMADLLTDLDACTTGFIENYKEAVVKAALEQRARLGQGPATQRDLAAITNISVDSTRRALETLVASGVVIENTSGRNQTYTLTTPPMVTTPAPAITDTQEVVIADVKANIAQSLDLDLGDIDAVRTLDPDLKAALDNIDAPVPLGAVLQDDGPDVEPAVVTQTQTEAPQWVTSTMIQAQAQQVLDDIQQASAEGSWQSEEQCPGNCPACDEDCGEDGEEPYDWNEVPVVVRDALYIQSQAVGMDLGQYLLTLAEQAENRLRHAVTGQHDYIANTLMNEVLTLQRRNANLQYQVNKAKKATAEG